MSRRTVSIDLVNSKVRAAVPWAIAEGCVNIAYGVGTVTIIGLAIAPEELGRAGIATAITLLVEACSALGLQDGIIRARSSDTRTTDSTFVLAGFFAVVGYGLAIALAAVLSKSIGTSDFVPLTAFAALAIPLNAIAAVPIGILARKLRARQLSTRIVMSKLCSIMVLAAGAALGAGATALIAAFVTSAATSCGFVWWSMPRKPRFRFDLMVAKEMMSFGIFVSIENLVWNLTVRLFTILFGQFHGMTALGYFQFAIRLTDELAALVQILVARLGLSFFSHIERSGYDVKPKFKLGTLILITIATPLFVGLAATCPLLLPALFDTRWAEAAPFVQVLALSWPLTFSRVLVSPILKAKGKVHVYTISLATTSVITLVACIATKSIDARYAIYAYVVGQIFAVPFGIYLAWRYIGIPVLEQLRTALLPAVGGLAIWITAWVIAQATNDWDTWPKLILMVSSCAAVYGGITLQSSEIRSILTKLGAPPSR